MNARITDEMVERVWWELAKRCSTTPGRDAIRYALAAALSQPEAEGMVLVPREPTPEMLRAAMNLKSPRKKYRDIYRAMLAAAPLTVEEDNG